VVRGRNKIWRDSCWEGKAGERERVRDRERDGRERPIQRERQREREWFHQTSSSRQTDSYRFLLLLWF